MRLTRNPWAVTIIGSILAGIVLIIIGNFLSKSPNPVRTQSVEAGGDINAPVVNGDIIMGAVPRIVAKHLLSSTAYQGGYRSDFSFVVQNPPEGNFTISYSPKSAQILAAPQLSTTDMQVGFGGGPFKTFSVSFLTDHQVTEDEFSFELKK